jgi:hypothetical protein
MGVTALHANDTNRSAQRRSLRRIFSGLEIEAGSRHGGAEVRYDTLFTPSFLAQVSPAQFRTIAAQLGSLGHFQIAKMTRPAPGAGAPGSAVIQLTSDKGYSMPMTLVVDQAAPNLVSGLVFGAPARITASLDDIMKELHALPGHASLYVARVNGSTLVPIVAEDTARAMALGSAFKLYVLAELVRQIEGGQRHWADVVPIDSMSKSLPSGFLQTWPAGTPITLQTLATLMISQSDNTAADHLLHILGRENVERIQGAAGHTQPSLNEPFLSTREMFVLKSPDRVAELNRYLAGSTAERRVVLADPVLVARQRRGPDFSKGPNRDRPRGVVRDDARHGARDGVAARSQCVRASRRRARRVVGEQGHRLAEHGVEVRCFQRRLGAWSDQPYVPGPTRGRTVDGIRCNVERPREGGGRNEIHLARHGGERFAGEAVRLVLWPTSPPPVVACSRSTD